MVLSTCELSFASHKLTLNVISIFVLSLVSVQHYLWNILVKNSRIWSSFYGHQLYETPVPENVLNKNTGMQLAKSRLWETMGLVSSTDKWKKPNRGKIFIGYKRQINQREYVAFLWIHCKEKKGNLAIKWDLRDRSANCDVCTLFETCFEKPVKNFFFFFTKQSG